MCFGLWSVVPVSCQFVSFCLYVVRWVCCVLELWWPVNFGVHCDSWQDVGLSISNALCHLPCHWEGNHHLLKYVYKSSYVFTSTSYLIVWEVLFEITHFFSVTYDYVESHFLYSLVFVITKTQVSKVETHLFEIAYDQILLVISDQNHKSWIIFDYTLQFIEYYLLLVLFEYST